MKITIRLISVILSVVLLFTACYISVSANEESNGETLFYATNAAAEMNLASSGVTRNTSDGTVTYRMTPYESMWTKYRTLPANVSGGSKYRIDFEIAINSQDAASIPSSQEIFSIYTSHIVNGQWANTGAVTVYKMDIPSTGPSDFVTYSYYLDYPDGDITSSEIKFYGGSRTIGFKVRGIKIYQVDEIKTGSSVEAIYNPFLHNQYKSEVLTKTTENGAPIGIYNPKNVLYNEGVHWESTWGPYTYTGFSNGLNKGYYRVDIEIALTGENVVSYVSDASNLISVGYKKYTVGDLAEDIDGDGYQTISYYFENEADGSIPEIQTRRLGNIGFKMRAFFFYAISEKEYNDGLNAKSDLVWAGTAAETMHSNAGAKIETDISAGTMTYNSDNIHSGHAIYGPYISLDKGFYRIDMDIAVNADDAEYYDSDDLLFNLNVSHSWGVAFGTSTDVLRGDIESTGRDDFGVYSAYVNVTQENVQAVEFQISTTNSAVGFIIREIRVYAVDELPDYMTGAQPIWSANAADMSSNVGLPSGNSLLLSPEMYVEYAASLFGPYVDFDAGEYKAVIVLKLQKERESDDEELGYFDVCYTDEIDNGDNGTVSKRLEGQFKKVIKAGDLTEDNIFCAVEIPVTFKKEAKGVEFRFFYSGNVPVKISKIALYRAEDEIPESAVKQDEILERPDDVEPSDYYDVPLTKENIRLLNKFNATFTENGKMGFVLEENIPGGIKSLRNKIYMTSGQKTVRIYLRTADEIAGEFTFLQLAILQNGAVSEYREFSLDDFAGTANLCIPYDFTIETDENKPIDFIVNWKGNASIYIDKIIISDGEVAIGNDIVINTSKISNGEKATVKRSDVAELDVIDNIKIVSEKGYVVTISAASVDAWFDGNDSFDFILNDVSSDEKSKLRSMAQSTGYTVNDIAVFSCSAVSGRKTLEDMPSTISVVSQIDKSMLSKNKGKLEAIGFFFDGNKYCLRKSSLDESLGEITVKIDDFGTVYSGLLIK